MTVRVDFITSTGTRDRNLDRFLEVKTDFLSVFIMLDGFSQTDANPHYVDSLIDEMRDKILSGMGFEDVISVIENIQSSSVKCSGKSSIGVVLISDTEVKTMTVGDVRIYFLIDGKRSLDDSLAQFLVSSGVSNPHFLNKHPYRNRLTKYLSKDSIHPIPAFSSKRIINGEAIFMCTDGFWSNFEDREILEVTLDGKLTTMFNDVMHSNDENIDNASVALLRFNLADEEQQLALA